MNISKMKEKGKWNIGNIWKDNKMPIEVRKKISEKAKERYKTRDGWKNPEYRELVDRKCTEFWQNHPNLKKEYSIKFKKYYRTHPEALKELLSYGEKSTKHYLKTKQNFKVKSKGEKEIADFLHKNKILSLYESIPPHSKKP